MLFIWVLGLALALQGQWFPARWLIAKLVPVALLSAFHGVLSGTLRQLIHGNIAPPSALQYYEPIGIIVSLVTIVILVVIKPV